MNNGKVTFKEYTMEQPQLLPPSLEELIPEDHLVVCQELCKISGGLAAVAGTEIFLSLRLRTTA